MMPPPPDAPAADADRGRTVAPPRVAGRVALPPTCDGARVLLHVLAALRRLGCQADVADDGTLVVGSRSERRGSVLGFVSDGRVWLGPDRVLRYAFSLRGGLVLCLLLAPVGAGLGWFALDSGGLALFGLLAPVLWLYGANHALAAVRIPAYMEELCRTAPRRASVPSTNRV